MTRFTVNNQPVEYLMDPGTPLLWALRDASNLTGTKFGCGTGQCGACTVDIDGEARRACQVTIAAIEGSFVTTIEGLSRERSHPVQLALIAANVPQCGFCLPGIVMAAAVLIRKKPRPSEDDIRRLHPVRGRAGSGARRGGRGGDPHRPAARHRRRREREAGPRFRPAREADGKLTARFST